MITLPTLDWEDPRREWPGKEAEPTAVGDW
jgi:hypothetical protein